MRLAKPITPFTKVALGFILGALLLLERGGGGLINAQERGRKTDLTPQQLAAPLPGVDAPDPEMAPVAWLDLADERSVRIVKSVRNARHFFVEPVFAMVLADRRFADLPPIVHDRVEKGGADEVALKFVVVTSTEAIRNHAKHTSRGPAEHR